MAGSAPWQGFALVEEVAGVIQRTPFHSEKAGCAVARPLVDDARDPVTVMGLSGTEKPDMMEETPRHLRGASAGPRSPGARR